MSDGFPSFFKSIEHPLWSILAYFSLTTLLGAFPMYNNNLASGIGAGSIGRHGVGAFGRGHFV
jgi:hypothetical protein